MKDQLTMACINLYAVLQNLENLVQLDEDSGLLIKNSEIIIQFTIRGGPTALLSFDHGRCRLQMGKGKHDINLYFTSTEHLNKMFDGKANPIPLKGITKISFMKNEFTKLTDRLSYFLKATDELLKDPKYNKINTILTFHTAFFALTQIANYDKIGKLNAGRIPDGVIDVSILGGGPSIQLNCSKGHLEAQKCKSSSPRAIMSFANMEVANSMLNNKIDAYTCIATGGVELKGYIPMLDYLNKLLSQVPEYLK